MARYLHWVGSPRQGRETMINAPQTPTPQPRSKTSPSIGLQGLDWSGPYADIQDEIIEEHIQ